MQFITKDILIAVTSKQMFPAKQIYAAYIHTVCKSILVVIAKSIRYRSFSCTQSGKCLHAHLVISYRRTQ